MSIQTAGIVAHLFMLVIAQGRPCFEGAHFEPCSQSNTTLKNKDVHTEVKDQVKTELERVQDLQSVQESHIYIADRRDMRGIPEEFNCTTCVDESDDIVDREDHITQYLAEFLVNTDSEITSLEARDVEEISENSGSSGKDDGYFTFLTGEEWETEGVWSHPARTLVDASEFVP